VVFSEWVASYGPASPNASVVAEPLPRYGRPH
jgi:hypothetical protein